MIVDESQKQEILQQVSRLVEKKYFNPEFSAEKWRALIDTKTPEILNGGSAEDFERRMHDLVIAVGLEPHRLLSPKLASRPTAPVHLRDASTMRNDRWPSLDVSGCSGGRAGPPSWCL